VTPRALAKRIAALAFGRKASDVQLIEMRKVSDVTDFFLICTGDSELQVKAIADAIEDGLAERDLQPWHREGISQRQWILLDFVDVVVHIFHKDVRKFYALEKLWGDAKIELLSDTLDTAVRGKRPLKKASPAPRRKSTATGKRSATKKAAPVRKSRAVKKTAAGPKSPAVKKTVAGPKSPAVKKTAAGPKSPAAKKTRSKRKPGSARRARPS